MRRGCGLIRATGLSSIPRMLPPSTEGRSGMRDGRDRTQRRLAAILFADVAGYSRMVAEDEAGTLASLRVLRRQVIEPRILAHGGRLFASLGDGFIAEFASAVEAGSFAVRGIFLFPFYRPVLVGRKRRGGPQIIPKDQKM